jgi:beta-glucan synthesis-associated protein KRE6
LEYGNKTKAALNPFFYGVTLVHKPASFTYQSDALSANTRLNATHYKDQHLYRVEWEPPEEDGSGGYIKWFIDGDLLYGVFGKSLEITGSEIPSEPMYLLMNTAVSSNWGFPKPCPDGCKCSCYQCGKPECACGLPYGYCDNFPAFFEIDYVRVYQAVNDTKHHLGCSTRERPTDLFIKGHAKRYMAEGDSMPLRPIRRGGDVCEDDRDCGGDKKDSISGHPRPQGICNDKKHCECLAGYTGPTCLAYDGYYDQEDVIVTPPFQCKCFIDDIHVSDEVGPCLHVMISAYLP